MATDIDNNLPMMEDPYAQPSPGETAANKARIKQGQYSDEAWESVENIIFAPVPEWETPEGEILVTDALTQETTLVTDAEEQMVANAEMPNAPELPRTVPFEKFQDFKIALARQVSKNEKLIMALEFYADEDNYINNEDDSVTWIEIDKGREARKVLAEMEGKE